MIDQREFNQQVVDILDQMVQEIERQRAGKTLSNLEGIRHSVYKLVNKLAKDEPRRI
jgi:hypothetical protein